MQTYEIDDLLRKKRFHEDIEPAIPALIFFEPRQFRSAHNNHVNYGSLDRKFGPEVDAITIRQYEIE